MEFSHKILMWYQKNKRSLPWRKNKNPYKIWLSEIILQQTQVIQGLPYYKRFISSFPTIKDLANAKEDSVLKLWQGLGYYNRARNLHHTAKEIVKKYDSMFPGDYETLLKLKGIGPYTAAAITSFAYNTPKAVVDSNVIRLLSRYFGISTSSDNSKGMKEFQVLAQKLLIKSDPSDYNQAIMEFGALQCKPKSPNCNFCILQSNCFAFNNDRIHNLPYRSRKINKTNKYFDFLIIEEQTNIFLQKRLHGIWKGLYQFPNIESKSQKTHKEIQETKRWKKLIKDSNTYIKKISPSIKHQLTHQTVYGRFWHINIRNFYNKNTLCIPKAEIKNYPIPRLLEKYLESIAMI